MLAPSPAPVTAVRAGVDLRVAFALVALYSIWGTTYLAMRVAVSALPPFGMAGARFVVAGAALLAFVRTRGGAWPSRRTWLVAVPLGALFFLVGNGLVVLAEVTLPSSVAAVVCATTPLVASAFAALRGEKPRASEIVGMLLGFGGVLVLAAGSPLAGSGRGLLVLLAPIGWSLGSLVARREKSGGLGSAAAQMVCGGVWLLGASIVLGERFPTAISLRSIAAWGYLVVFGSIVGFSAYSWLLRNARPAVAMSYAYVNPVVAVLAGALLGGEGIGWASVAATTLIALGVMAAVLRRRPDALK